jgi:hypothetical protein
LNDYNQFRGEEKGKWEKRKKISPKKEDIVMLQMLLWMAMFDNHMTPYTLFENGGNIPNANQILLPQFQNLLYF